MTKPTRNPDTANPDLAIPNPADPETNPPYNPYDLFLEHGPLNPVFMEEAVRSLLRTLPADPVEPPDWGQRRMFSTMLALSALHPRDEIEVLIGVQALAAWHAAAACWRIGMNHHRPNGDSTRHITTAATAARTFDSLLRALERRQAKPLCVPVGRPAARVWSQQDPTGFMLGWEGRCGRDRYSAAPDPALTQASPDNESTQASPDNASAPVLPSIELPGASTSIWTPKALSLARQMLEQAQTDADNEGLDIANTGGILLGGGMIVPEHPTPQQEAYMARRFGLSVQHKRQDNLRRGSPELPEIGPIRVGDLIP
jgi:hypothetical protein